MAAPGSLKPQLQKLLEEYRTVRAFDPKAWVEKKTAKLNQYMAAAGLKCTVTSISGGVDSAVTLAICAAAAKAENSPIQKNVGVCQPIYSSPWALNRGKENIKALNAVEIVVDQSPVYDLLKKTCDTAAGIEGGDWQGGMLKSYMRTPVGYYVTQLMSKAGFPAVVMGTGNQDEDGYLAYFCKAGDGCVDLQVISDLHKSEVFKVGRFLGVPSNTLDAAPSADLWDGQTDEGELGFTYDFVELLTGAYLPLDDAGKAAFEAKITDGEDKKQWDDWKAAAMKVHARNKHKLNGVVNL